LAQHLLTHCPKLKILVTGREALFIAGETTLQIPSLSLPSGNGDSNLEEIRASEGVQLFVARAQDIHPDFELGPANAATIAEIVRRLDGIPLALELATARLRMLSVEQIAERLDDRFRLLTGGRRTALPRQQTLQAMIDWSWNLLGEKERLLLQRLSVFSGGWTLEAAQAVAGSDQRSREKRATVRWKASANTAATGYLSPMKDRSYATGTPTTTGPSPKKLRHTWPGQPCLSGRLE
jgi:predicted ATPase